MAFQTLGYDEGYLEGFKQGGDQMEKAKQFIIDRLLKEIDELKKQIINRPMELYAIEDCFTGEIIFNARGGCYRDISDANDKVSRLYKENKDRNYRIVTYRLQ